MVGVSQRIQGREVLAEEVEWLRGWVARNRTWSRRRIARELCEAWGWRDRTGRLKDFAARSFLLKLELEGAIELPPLRKRAAGVWRWQPRVTTETKTPGRFEAALNEVRPVSIEVMESGGEAYGRWSGYLGRHHYLGLRVVGENLGYLVRSRDGRDLACLLFGAAAWKCASRDRYLGWSAEERAGGLSTIANNTRFLVLPWVRVSCLASHILGLVARRIESDWRKKYGHGLSWLESFVETERFLGTCYRAANWTKVGQTTGRSRQDRERRMSVGAKDVYLYGLERNRR